MAITLKSFAPIFEKLAGKLQAKRTSPGMVEAYHEALEDLSYEQVNTAALQLGRSAKYFPKTSEWRAEALAVAPAQGVRGDTQFHDADRWTFHQCPADPCGRSFAHLPHDYMRPRKLLSTR